MHQALNPFSQASKTLNPMKAIRKIAELATETTDPTQEISDPLI